MNPFSGFFALNRRLSCALADRLPPTFTRHLHTLYKYQVAEMLIRQPGQVVVDVGGGKECPFLPYVAEPHSHPVIALDCSADELRGNRKVDVSSAQAKELVSRDGQSTRIRKDASRTARRSNSAGERNNFCNLLRRRRRFRLTIWKALRRHFLSLDDDRAEFPAYAIAAFP